MGVWLTQQTTDPVAVAAVMSKLLEQFILCSISLFLGTRDNQLVLRLVMVVTNVQFC